MLAAALCVHVVLSEAKNLRSGAETLRDAQGDNRMRIIAADDVEPAATECYTYAVTAPSERMIFCPKCRRPCWVTRQVISAGETIPVEYYCPVHGTVVVEYGTKPKVKRPGP